MIKTGSLHAGQDKVLVPGKSSRRLHLEDLKEGEVLSYEFTVHWWHILFTLLASWDFNQIHWNPFFAKKKNMKGVVAHGVLSVNRLSGIIGYKFFADGSEVTSIEIEFREKVYLGDIVTIEISPENINRRGRVRFQVKVFNQNNKEVINGTCNVWIPPRFRAAR